MATTGTQALGAQDAAHGTRSDRPGLTNARVAPALAGPAGTQAPAGTAGTQATQAPCR
jgi:hypothetical protein